MITIFTPSYNRAYRLPALFESLQGQTVRDFEWILVDDGSTDGTEGLAERFKADAKFPFTFRKVENGGKHRAINTGVKMASGELFFIVDSDDVLSRDAVERVLAEFEGIRSDSSFCGVCGMKVFPDGKRIGGEAGFVTLDCSALDFRYRYKVKGDLAEVFRTDVLRQYPFPEFDGEKFCPEALVFERIAEKYRMRYFNAGIYVCEYLPDGLTAKIHRLLRKNPKATRLYFKENMKRDIPCAMKAKALINLIRYSL